MKNTLLTLLLAASLTASAQDLMPDTWVGHDALGRQMPGAEECPLRQDGKERTVGIFYITWHTQNLHNGLPYRADVSRVLAQDPQAAREWENPAWSGPSYHWGEPEMGYFLSQDRWVIRRDMSMLADAGVDVIILDVTNAVCYWDEWEVVLSEMEQMKREGNRVPKFCFWAFNGNVITVVTQLYERYYATPRYQDLWFHWKGKPLLLCNATPHVDANVGGGEKNATDYPQAVKDFFTLRGMWWGYYTWAGERYVGTEDHWSFGFDLGDPRVLALTPEERCARHEGQLEQMAVTPAQHPISNIGKCWSPATGEPALNQLDMPDSAFVRHTGRVEKDPVRWGIYFQDRWDEALQVDPEFIYLNDWNEWTAGRYVSGKDPGGHVPGPTGFIGRDNPFYFVDQYNAEFNRTIQPMRDGYTDNYYMQMAANIRRYKGVRPPTLSEGFRAVKADGHFADWQQVQTEFLDTRGDILHRNHPGYGAHIYTDSTGRNDIVRCKVAVDKRSVHFYAETAAPLTPPDGPNWMLLYIDADQNPATGWQGFDYLLSAYDPASRTAKLQPYDAASGSFAASRPLMVPCGIGENQLEVSLPRKALGLRGKAFALDFKWADNPTSAQDIISLSTTGDTAPNRRFCYRFLWRK